MDSNQVTVYHQGTTYTATYEVIEDIVSIASPSFDIPPVRAIKGVPQDLFEPGKDETIKLLRKKECELMRDTLT